MQSPIEMKRGIWLAIALAAVATLGVTRAAPASAQATDAAQWAKAWTEGAGAKKLGSLGLIRQLSVVHGFRKGGMPRFAVLDTDAFARTSLARVISSSDARLTFQLNDWPHPRAKSSSADALANVFKLLDVDAIAIAPEGKVGGDWRLVMQTGTQQDAEQTSVSAPRAATLSAATLAGWMQTALGWDGVVVDVKGEWVLVVSAAGPLDASSQGIVIADSSTKRVLDRSQATAIAIVEAVSVNGPFAVMKRIIARGASGSDEAGIAPGAKVLFSRGK